MNRRTFFATMLAPFVAAFVPKRGISLATLEAFKRHTVPCFRSNAWQIVAADSEAAHLIGKRFPSWEGPGLRI